MDLGLPMGARDRELWPCLVLEESGARGGDKLYTYLFMDRGMLQEPWDPTGRWSAEGWVVWNGGGAVGTAGRRNGLSKGKGFLRRRAR